MENILSPCKRFIHREKKFITSKEKAFEMSLWMICFWPKIVIATGDDLDRWIMLRLLSWFAYMLIRRSCYSKKHFFGRFGNIFVLIYVKQNRQSFWFVWLTVTIVVNRANKRGIKSLYVSKSIFTSRCPQIETSSCFC